MIATQKSKGIWEAEEINLTLKVSVLHTGVSCAGRTLPFRAEAGRTL